MRKTSAVMAALLFLGASCDQLHAPRPSTQAPAWKPAPDGEIKGMGSPPQKSKRQEQALGRKTGIERNKNPLSEEGGYLDERKRQIPAIAASFARRTDPQRARRLASLCYSKTLGTTFMPIDMAEIALAETGSHGLSGKAVSRKGALGVWQLMPHRARSHGYSPKEMKNDRKCADAAVRELAGKLAMAKGDLARAKKLYCGIGREADAFDVKRRQFRKEILASLGGGRPEFDRCAPVKAGQALWMQANSADLILQ